MSFFVENAWIIAALPLWVFLIIVFGRNLGIYEDKKVSMLLTVGATAIGLIFSAFILGWTITSPEQTLERNFTWIQAGDINLSVGWLVDNLSAMMLMVVTSVSLLVQIYSHDYMKDDEGYHRFFAYLALFNFSMLGLVLSTNLFQMYIFWELVGVSSYLLIGFWFRKPSAADAAKKAFIMNRIGDCGFLIGILAFLYFSLSWWQNNGNVYLAFGYLKPAAEHVLGIAGPVVFGLIGLALFFGPIAKSAQFPLHTWLPDAMEGPTPISALIHAATMVAAGVFLIARVYPIFELSPPVMAIIACIGVTTALLGAIIAITQFDIKKALAYSTISQLGLMVMAMGVGAYSTISQLGLMVMAMGVGAYSAGLFHLVTHAYFKAMLFLCSGAVIHGLSGQQDMRYMGGLRKKMPSIAYTYLIGTFAISGILLSGFWSKEEILTGLFTERYLGLFWTALVISGMTSFYMFRTYFLTFEGEYRGQAHPHNPSKIMTLPLIILAIPSTILGYTLSGKLNWAGISSFSSFIAPEHISEHHQNFIVLAASLLVAFGGALIAAFLYWDKLSLKSKIKPDDVRKNLKTLYSLSLNKFYIDDVYNWFIRTIFIPTSSCLSAFDKYIVDGIVNLTAFTVAVAGTFLRMFQTGNVQTYATILFGGFTTITVLVLLYWLI